MRGLPIPIDASDFQVGLKQRFVERDGMYFTQEQAVQNMMNFIKNLRREQYAISIRFNLL